MKIFRPQPTSSHFDILDKAESPYNTLYVIENNRTRELWFKGGGQFFLQSRLDLDAPESLALVYSHLMLASLLFRPDPKKVLMIGLGAGAVSQCLHRLYPRAHIDVVEVDPAVIACAKKYFFLKEARNYQVHEGDGRMFIQRQRGETPYDIVLLDAFKSGSVPYHLKTGEFYQEIRDILHPEGVVVSNLYGKSNRLKPADCQTFLSVFEQVHCFEDPDRVATALVATRDSRRRSQHDLERAARTFTPDLPFSMKALAAMHKEPGWKDASQDAFRDDFPAGGLHHAVERNNLKPGLSPRYPIKSVS